MIKMRFGLEDGEEKTLREIGDGNGSGMAGQAVSAL